MAVPRIPAVRRRASVVLLGDPKADEMPAARLADRWHTLGFFPKACGLLRSHGCNEPAPPGIVDKRRRTSRGSLVIGSPLSCAALADVVQEQDGRSRFQCKVLQTGHHRRHVPVAVFVKTMHAAQRIQHNEARPRAPLHQLVQRVPVRDTMELPATGSTVIRPAMAERAVSLRCLPMAWMRQSRIGAGSSPAK